MALEGVCRIPGRTGFFRYEFADGTLNRLEPVSYSAVRRDGQADEAASHWLTPGLFDIQVNGMLGYNLSDTGLKAEHLFEIGEEFLRRGVTRWCPTVTTQDPSIVESSLQIIADAMEQGAPGAYAIHMEGHYISDEEGYRGVHMKEFIRDPDFDEFKRWQEKARGKIGLFSLAPARAGSLPFIEMLRRQGVRAALVHHNDSYETVRKAVACGADLASHLVNGCAKTIHRQHNVIWAQLALDEMWASFIADGFHIPSYTLRAIIKSKGVNRSILISDLAHLSGLPDGEYTKYNNTVVMKDGGLWVKGHGTDLLSGAVKTLNEDCEYLANNAGFSIEEALLMGSDNPIRYFGLEHDLSLRSGVPGPLVLFSWKNNSLNVERILQ